MEDSRQPFFSKRKCQQLISEHRFQKTQKTLRNLINQVTKLEISMACEVSLQEIMLQLLSVFSNTRNEAVDERLMCYLRTIKWFRETFEAESPYMRKFIKSFEVVRVDRWAKIIKKGDNSQHFFILIKGRACILKEIEPEVKEQGDKPKQLRRQQSFIDRVPNPLYWKQVHTLEQGEHFGDLGIIYKKKRMATIIAKTPCTMIRIPAQAFIQISAEGTLKQHQKRLKFICQSLSAKFQSLTYQELQQTVLHFEPVRFSYGNVIYRNDSNYFLVIEQGQALCLTKNKGEILKRQRMSTGKFIGINELKQQFQQNDNTRAHRNTEFIAHTAYVETYQISKSYLTNLLKSHKDIYDDIIEKQIQITCRSPSKPLCQILRQMTQQSIRSKTTANTARDDSMENCRISQCYSKMQRFIIRKKAQIKSRNCIQKHSHTFD